MSYDTTKVKTYQPVMYAGVNHMEMKGPYYEDPFGAISDLLDDLQSQAETAEVDTSEWNIDHAGQVLSRFITDMGDGEYTLFTTDHKIIIKTYQREWLDEQPEWSGY